MPLKIEMFHFFVLGKIDSLKDAQIWVSLHKSTAVKCMRARNLIKVENKEELKKIQDEAYKLISGGAKHPAAGDIIMVERRTITRVTKARVRIPKAAVASAKPVVKAVKRIKTAFTAVDPYNQKV